MSVCTKGFIATEFKNPFSVMGLVEKYLQRLIRPHWTRRRAMARTAGQKQGPFEQPKFHITSPGSGLVSVSFTYKGEARSLSLNFLCDCDNQEVVEGGKVHLSLGDSGMSRPLMLGLLQVLSVFGPAYYDACDSDDGDPAAVWTQRRVTLMDLFAADLEHLSQVTVNEWYRMWKACPQLQDIALPDFIGLTEEEVLRLEEASPDYEEGKRLMSLLLEEYQASMEPLDLRFSAIDECFPDWTEEAEEQSWEQASA